MTAAAHLAFTGKFAKNDEATTSKTRQLCRYDRKEEQVAGIESCTLVMAYAVIPVSNGRVFGGLWWLVFDLTASGRATH